MKVKCTSCSAEIEYIEGECSFCPECGSELMPHDAASGSPGADGPELCANDDCMEIRRLYSSGMENDERSLSERSMEIAENIESIDFSEYSQSECPHLKVEYNQNLFFLSGLTSVIKLRLTPLDNKLQDLLIFMESEREGGNSRRQIPVREVLKKGRTFFLQVPYNPEDTCGRMFLSFYIGCKINGSFVYYQFFVEHKIYDSTQSGTALCSQITINQEFTSNHAADINYRDSIGDALKKMSEKTLSVNEMIDRLNDLPPKYKVQQLAKTTWRPEDILIKGNLYPADKLLLEFDGKTIFILNKPSVVLGRDPGQVDLLVRCGCGSMGAREYPNSTVSRKHAGILYCDDTVKLFDYSSYGTYINDRRPDSAGIPLDSNAIVEFGDIHWKMNIQKCYARLPHNICQTCSACQVKSMTFTRTDSEPEYYLLIWQCCELGRVIESLTDWTIFSRNGCFFIRTPEQNFYHLRPGQTISSKNKQIKVKYFEQN